MRRWLCVFGFLLGFLSFQRTDAKLIGLRWLNGHDGVISTTCDPKSEDDDVCSINKSKRHEEQCLYVQEHSDACEGGGYLTWTRFVICEESVPIKVLIIGGSVLYLFVLFLMISSAADDFFCPNISAIVTNLGVSESIAGVTFLAFGNGAPDIFNSIASVLSNPNPKAGLALGELLGAGIFVTLMVTAMIVITRPFKVAKFETIRNIIFYLCGLGWILFVFLYDSSVHLWQPLGLLGFYSIYVVTVMFRHYQHKKRKETQRSIAMNVPQSDVVSNRHQIDKGDGPEIKIDTIKKNLESDEAEDEDSDDMIWTGHELVRQESYRSRMNSMISLEKEKNFKSLIVHLCQHLGSNYNWDKANIMRKVYNVIMIPIMVVFKLTMPLCELAWSKPLCILHAIIAPNSFLFAVHLSSTVPIRGGPALWAYALVLSALVVLFIFFFTKIDEEPRFYKVAYMYTGFLMAISWVYVLASELVSVVMMFGVLTQLSPEILGLTILAWSNSIGDLIADLSVARQGHPNMALAAAIGGPLFNIFIGFGLPFSLARIKGTHVRISFTSVNHILILFLAISLIFTLAAIIAQKFHLRRPYAICLIIIYCAFLIIVIMAENRVFVWGHI